MEKQDRSILIIDDDKSILNIFARILRKQGYHADTAETAQEALEKLGECSYDLALIDVKLPDTNGTDLLVKMNLASPNMTKIIITGFPSLEDATKAIDRGAAAYLVKPVKSEELVKIVAEQLKKKEAERSS